MPRIAEPMVGGMISRTVLTLVVITSVYSLCNQRTIARKCAVQWTVVLSPMNVQKNRAVSTRLLIACGIWLLGLGLYFMFLRPPLLPEDTRFMGTTVAQARIAVPGLESWLAKVFWVVGGFMAGAGVLTVFVATVAMPRRLKGTSWAIALSGTLTVVLMSATNFAIHSDFRWSLLVPALVWFLGLAFYLARR